MFRPRPELIADQRPTSCADILTLRMVTLRGFPSGTDTRAQPRSSMRPLYSPHTDGASRTSGQTIPLVTQHHIPTRLGRPMPVLGLCLKIVRLADASTSVSGTGRYVSSLLAICTLGLTYTPTSGYPGTTAQTVESWLVGRLTSAASSPPRLMWNPHNALD
jgi:hypothetical protein